MTAEQFTAFLANLSVGTFLNKTAYVGLTADQQAAYDAKAASVASTFRAKNPNGLTVHYPISNINVGEKVAFVVYPTPAPTRNTVFQFQPNYAANMVSKSAVPNVATLVLIHGSSLDDNFLTTTFVVAIKGETYENKKTGEVKTYEQTTLRNVDDAITLGGSAKGMLREVAMAQLSSAIQGNSRTAPVNRNRIAVDEQPEVEHEQEPVAEEQL